MNEYYCSNLKKIDTLLNADSVEWCPYLGLQDTLLCGTYKLQESGNHDEAVETESEENQASCKDTKPVTETATPQIRHGGVQVYKLAFDQEATDEPSLLECDKIDMCGVLDIKWPEAAATDTALYGLVDAEGYIQILSLDRDHRTTQAVTKDKLSESCLGLSLGWTGPSEGSLPKVAASDSAGCVTVFSLSASCITKLDSWKAHDYEAWITAFHRFDSNIVFSGGDDCKLKGWDLRDTARPIFTSKRHQMGVCSVQSHPFQEHLFATGSYDEDLLVWDDRSMKQPLCSASLGGGVWRIKWDPFAGDYILTATMYNGTHIVDFSKKDDATMPVISQYNDHNLAYGADWCRLDTERDLRQTDEEGKTKETSSAANNNKKYLISTCSFYDHALHLWKWTIK